MAKFKLEIEDEADGGMRVDIQIDEIGGAKLEKNTATQNLAIFILDQLDQMGVKVATANKP